MFLGINAFSHDSSAAIVGKDGNVIAAVEEERFTRRKKESRFPREAIMYCLRTAGISADELLGLGLAWNPWPLLWDRVLKEDILSEHVALRHIFKDGRKAYRCLRLRRMFEREISPLGKACKIFHFRHHYAHAASALFGSDFDEAAFLTIDGRGERETATWGEFRSNKFLQTGALKHPNSLGNFYTGFARFCGFFNSDMEGTAMAFAGVGKPNRIEDIRRVLSLNGGVFEPGSIQMDTRFLNCESGDAMPNAKLSEFLGLAQREPESGKWAPYPDISASVQSVLEECVLNLARKLSSEVKSRRLVLAGGVALNSVANGRLFREGPFPEIFIQPAAHDAVLALGCALIMANADSSKRLPRDTHSPFYGPEFSHREILTTLQEVAEVSFSEPLDIVEAVADLLSEGRIVGWFQGRLEFGPRALGNRSLLADPRDSRTVERLNRIKRRQSFRPFAVAIIHSERKDWLCDGFESPHMLIVDRLKPDRAACVPAAMHVDGSVRTQTVQKQDNILFYALLHSFFKRTGVPMVVNTSLNVGGEPLACTPADAVRAFLESEIDALAIGNFLVSRK